MVLQGRWVYVLKSIFSAIFAVVGYFINLNSLTQEIMVGSLAIKMVLSVPIAFLLLYGLFQYFRWACFKKVNKIAELWCFGYLA
jgi:hypothetical protein